VVERLHGALVSDGDEEGDAVAVRPVLQDLDAESFQLLPVHAHALLGGQRSRRGLSCWATRPPRRWRGVSRWLRQIQRAAVPGAYEPDDARRHQAVAEALDPWHLLNVDSAHLHSAAAGWRQGEGFGLACRKRKVRRSTLHQPCRHGVAIDRHDAVMLPQPSIETTTAPSTTTLTTLAAC